MRTSSRSPIIAMLVIAACAHAAAEPAGRTTDRATRVAPGDEASAHGDAPVADRRPGRASSAERDVVPAADRRTGRDASAERDVAASADRGGDGDDGAAADRPADEARTEGVPPISAVLAAAHGAAGLDRDPGRSWVRRTRLAGLVPWLTVRTTRETSWQDAQSEVGHGTTLEVRATWRLDRLLFDGHELQVATIEAARRRERMRLSSHVIRAYFAWLRAATGQSRASEDRTATTRAEATAELDALTDGWFSEELARRSGSAGQPPRYPTGHQAP